MLPARLSSLRRLIINADDFGLTAGVNRAIVEAHVHGVVTSATLMANAPAFADAVELASSSPRLSVGCHVVLVDGAPLLAGSQISSLINQTEDSRFYRSLGSFGFRALTGRFDPLQIEAEATAQIRKLQSAGISVSHLDTHKHTHVFPQVWQPLLRAAKACGVRAMRNPFEAVRFSQLADSPNLWKRWIGVKALHSSAAKFQRATQQAGMITPGGTLGIVSTGALDERLFHLAIENMPEGRWEFVCHPGYNDAQLQSSGTRLVASRALELEVLTSASIRPLLTSHGIELISYSDLA